MKNGCKRLFALWLCLSPAAGAWAATPSMSDDFTKIMGWLSQEMAQGLAFNAGSAFDPPQEVRGLRILPDMSLGAGVMPLDKNKFPQPRTQALKDMGVAGVFPSKFMFPNFTMHLRAGLPGRSDIAIRVSDMTTPPNYKISANTVGKAQSNTIGFAVRKHFLGGSRPTLGIGANVNHVFGNVKYKTSFNIDTVPGFSAKSAVNGATQWNISSFGLNAVVSQRFGIWTPFVGVGYNYATGSVRARIEILSDTPLISPIVGESSSHPESSQGRFIFGTQMNRSWVNLFFNGEVKAIGVHAGESWIVQTGLMMPFRIGSKSLAAKESSYVPVESSRAVRKQRAAPAYKAPAAEEAISDLIFIQ